MLQIIFFVIFIYVTLGFILSVILKRNDIADVMWGPGIFLSAFTTFTLGVTSLLVYVLLMLVFIWALRIFLHIGKRFLHKKEEDRRYAIWRTEWKYFYLRSYFQVFLLQGFLMFLVSSTIIVVSAIPAPEINLFFLILGILIALFGLYFEWRADRELTEFLSLSENSGKILQTGVWKMSRHPNYFGEVTFWWGIYIATLPNLNPLLLIGPATITFLILKVSGIPLLEKKYIGNVEFEAYKKVTPAFFPKIF